MKIGKPMRVKGGSRRLNVAPLRAALGDGPRYCVSAIVTDNDGSGNHWEVITEGGRAADVLVECEIVPQRVPVTASLASPVANGGIWAIPAVGDEVVIVMPDGDFTFAPTIVGILSRQDVPSRVSEERVVWVSTVPVEIDAPKVYLGSEPGSIVEVTDGLVHGSGIDPFTGQTYAALQSTTSRVFAKK